MFLFTTLPVQIEVNETFKAFSPSVLNPMCVSSNQSSNILKSTNRWSCSNKTEIKTRSLRKVAKEKAEKEIRCLIPPDGTSHCCLWRGNPFLKWTQIFVVCLTFLLGKVLAASVLPLIPEACVHWREGPRWEHILQASSSPRLFVPLNLL